MDELRTRIGACIEVERMAAEVYRKLAVMFPDDGDFWRGLAVEEETHEAILIMARGASSSEKIPDEIVPVSLTAIKENVADAKRIYERLKEGISLEDAFTFALDLERTVVEIYVQESLGNKWGHPIVSKLKALLDDSETHMERIEKYAKERGL